MLFVLLISYLSAANAMNFWDFLEKYNRMDLSAVARAVDNSVPPTKIQEPPLNIDEIMKNTIQSWQTIGKNFEASIQPILQALDKTTDATEFATAVGAVRQKLAVNIDGPLQKIFQSQAGLTALLKKVLGGAVKKTCDYARTARKDCGTACDRLESEEYDVDEPEDEPYFDELLETIYPCVSNMWDTYAVYIEMNNQAPNPLYDQIEKGTTVMFVLQELSEVLEDGPLEDWTPKELWEAVLR